MDDENPFADYHRYRRRQAAIRVVSTVAPIAIVVGLFTWASAAGGTSTPMPVPSFTDSTGSPSPSPSPSAAVANALPANPSPEARPWSEPTPASGPRDWTIDIDTVGYQDELDQCLWVRMDLVAAAPIVGAHNYCGGGIVLEMVEGDAVTLTGTQLDGDYRVTGEREARAGDNAVTATDGLIADVILQTCHWNSGGRERLVTLEKV